MAVLQVHCGWSTIEWGLVGEKGLPGKLQGFKQSKIMSGNNKIFQWPPWSSHVVSYILHLMSYSNQCFLPSGVRPGGQEEQGVYWNSHKTKGRNSQVTAGQATVHSSPWCKVPKNLKYTTEGGNGSRVKSNPELSSGEAKVPTTAPPRWPKNVEVQRR